MSREVQGTAATADWYMVEASVPDGGAGGAPILYWFRARLVPAGGAPEPIRRLWVGVPLPVRDPRPVEGPLPYIGSDVIDRRTRRLIPDGVAVVPADALRSLRLFGRVDAADWWEDLLRSRPHITSLVFRRAEGDLLPPRLAKMLHPELDDLDPG